MSQPLSPPSTSPESIQRRVQALLSELEALSTSWPEDARSEFKALQDANGGTLVQHDKIENITGYNIDIQKDSAGPYNENDWHRVHLAYLSGFIMRLRCLNGLQLESLRTQKIQADLLAQIAQAQILLTQDRQRLDQAQTRNHKMMIFDLLGFMPTLITLQRMARFYQFPGALNDAKLLNDQLIRESTQEPSWADNKTLESFSSFDQVLGCVDLLTIQFGPIQSADPFRKRRNNL